MSAVLDLPVTHKTSIQTVKKAMKFALEEQVSVILSDVAWETYDRFVQETMDKIVNPRFYFEKETLLIMPVTAEHEFFNRSIASLIDILAEEFRINSRSLGSSTYQREDIEKGFEPDSCFYFDNEPKIRGVKRLDMTTHPAPDLIIEVDITSLSTGRQNIFAAFGVPEIWRYDGDKMQILKLENEKYVEINKSLSLPKVSVEKLSEFIFKSETLSRLDWITEAGNWAKTA